PWDDTQPGMGFGPSSQTWLPQPRDYATLSVRRQNADPASPLARYQDMLSLRRQHRLGTGKWQVLETEAELHAFDNGGIRIIMNPGDWPVDASSLMQSRSLVFESRFGSLIDGILAPRSTVWLEPSA